MNLHCTDSGQEKSVSSNVKGTSALTSFRQDLINLLFAPRNGYTA